MRSLILALLVAPALAEEPALPADAAEALEAHGIAVGRKPAKQIFEFYIGGKLPLFITSDSLLSGFHVLFEESVVRLERARAARLADTLALLYRHAPAGLVDMEVEAETRRAAVRRLRIVLATALLLCGRDVKDAPPEAAAEAARIERAEGRLKPEWLGPPDEGFRAIDYARFKPRGFYTRSPALARLFRATAWLQAIPFRIARDEELVALLFLHELVGDFDLRHRMDFEQVERSRDALSGYRGLLGPADDVALVDMLNMWTSNLAEMRKAYETGLQGTERIQDQIATRNERSVRLMPTAGLPDSRLFQRTAALRWPPRGLEVAAALGSAWAHRQLDANVRGVVDAAAKEFFPSSHYGSYLRCLAALVDEPEPDAPALFSSDAWQRKSCHTVLAGWAQMRHTWSLQAKRVVLTLGLSRTPAGFVEPEPEFFARIGRLARGTRHLLGEKGAFDLVHDRRELVRVLKAGARLLRTVPAERLRGVRSDAGMLGIRTGDHWAYMNGLELEAEDPAFLKLLDDLAAALEDESRPLEGKLETLVRESRFDLEESWRAFEHLAQRLETMAHKQLRRVAFSPAEEWFIKGYGEELAHVMFYGGNTFSKPRDDAMRITDVAHDARDRRLHVGVGRPHPIWLKYPWQGEEVLCVGGVMAYYEFENDTPLTDAEWKRRLDADGPRPPAWARPLYGKP